MDLTVGQKLTIKTISLPVSLSTDQNKSEENPLVLRLFEMGFHCGIEIEILHILSAGHIIVIGMNETVVSLTRKEFLCLKF